MTQGKQFQEDTESLRPFAFFAVGSPLTLSRYHLWTGCDKEVMLAGVVPGPDFLSMA